MATVQFLVVFDPHNNRSLLSTRSPRSGVLVAMLVLVTWRVMCEKEGKPRIILFYFFFKKGLTWKIVEALKLRYHNMRR